MMETSPTSGEKLSMTLLTQFLDDTKVGTQGHMVNVQKSRGTATKVEPPTTKPGTLAVEVPLSYSVLKEEKVFDVRHAFYPLCVSMRCFGLIWRNPVGLLGREKCTDLSTVHCTAVLIVAWINALKYFVTYNGSDQYGTILFQKVGRHIYCLQLAVGITSQVYHRYVS